MEDDKEQKKIPIHGHNISKRMQATIDSMNRNSIFGATNPHNISAYYGSMGNGLQNGELMTLMYPSLGGQPKSDITPAIIAERLKLIQNTMGVPSRLLGLSPKYMNPKETNHPINKLMTQLLRSRKMIKYLDRNFRAFWEQIFTLGYEEASAEGLITAHHDKIDQYRDTWEEAGLDFNVCAMIYLLTFTSEMDRPKPESEQWVMDNYIKYLKYTQPWGEYIKEIDTLGYQHLSGGMSVMEIVEDISSAYSSAPEDNVFMKVDPVLHSLAHVANSACITVLDEVQRLNEKYETNNVETYRLEGDEPIDTDNRLKSFMQLKKLIMETEIMLNRQGFNTNLVDNDVDLSGNATGFPQAFKDKISEVLTPETANDQLKTVFKDGEIVDEPTLTEVCTKSTEQPLPINYLTFDEIVIDLIQTIDQEDKDILAKMPKDDLISLHHTLGQYIRNMYQLWEPTCPLTAGADPTEDTEDSRHPDDVSFKIIEAFWTKLNEDKNVE